MQGVQLSLVEIFVKVGAASSSFVQVSVLGFVGGHLKWSPSHQLEEEWWRWCSMINWTVVYDGVAEYRMPQGTVWPLTIGLSAIVLNSRLSEPGLGKSDYLRLVPNTSKGREPSIPKLALGVARGDNSEQRSFIDSQKWSMGSDAR
jgi:hypothetical protein